MKIIVGLGNPGQKYLRTRHNVGFMVVDNLAAAHGVEFEAKRFLFSDVATVRSGREHILLVKPQTFMNDSGRAVTACLRKHRCIEPEAELMVVYDDVSLDFGRARLRKNGSAGGHNGMDSIIRNLGSDGFARLKVGIRNAFVPADLAAFVLAAFSAEERQGLETIVPACAGAVERFIRQGAEPAANWINGKCLLDKDSNDKKEEN